MTLTKEWFAARNERLPEHIGDGVYASLGAGNQIWLRTERGGMIHEIALDLSTFNSLLRYQRRQEL